MKISRREMLDLMTATGVGAFANPPARGGQATSKDFPNFKLRCIKGWGWTIEQYLEEIPYLVKLKFNFLMNCYISMCDIENYNWGDDRVNRWWEPLPEAKKKGFEQIVKNCQKAGIEFCFSMNPNIFTECPIRPTSENIDSLWQHYDWMQSLGVRWFNISLDDAGALEAENHAYIANELMSRLHKKDSSTKMIVCPRIYWGTGKNGSRVYLEKFGQLLNPQAYVFWTGDTSITSRITSGAAKSFREVIQHELIIWDNYPVNDGNPTMHLGPLRGRDPRLCEITKGIMFNPMFRQNRLGRIPISTCADFALDPYHYDPQRSINRAINQIAKNKEQRQILKDLVLMYPGMILLNQNQFHNPVRERFIQILANRSSVLIAERYVSNFAALVKNFNNSFDNYYSAEKQTFNDDLDWLKKSLIIHYKI